MNRVIFQQDNRRIIEVQDLYVYMDDLKGDCYKPEHNPDIDPETLAQQEKDFEEHVDTYGVFSYHVEEWNPEVDKGWEHIDGCTGFVGEFDESEENFNHHIVHEYKASFFGESAA